MNEKNIAKFPILGLRYSYVTHRGVNLLVKIKGQVGK